MNKGTGLKSRIIPIIQVLNKQVVKSRQFSDERRVGNIEQTIEAYNRRHVDEIIILDSGASKQGTGVDFELIENITSRSLMPVAYGGGITSLDDISTCLALGCDKVIINHYALKQMGFVKQAMNEFGVQAIIVALDLCWSQAGELCVYDHVTQCESELLSDYAQRLNDMGIGELFITSITHDGMMQGYDFDALALVLELMNPDSPILFNGGCGHPKHMQMLLEQNVSACCGSSIFLYSEFSYSDIKQYLQQQGCAVRSSKGLMV